MERHNQLKILDFIKHSGYLRYTEDLWSQTYEEGKLFRGMLWGGSYALPESHLRSSEPKQIRCLGKSPSVYLYMCFSCVYIGLCKHVVACVYTCACQHV